MLTIHMNFTFAITVDKEMLAIFKKNAAMYS